MAKAGHFGGNPEIVAKTELKYALQMYHYEIFTKDYEKTVYELNKKENVGK